MTWTPSSWRARPAKHIPEDYPDLDHLKDVEQRLAAFPPLVFAGEVRTLKQRLASVEAGGGLRRRLAAYAGQQGGLFALVDGVDQLGLEVAAGPHHQALVGDVVMHALAQLGFELLAHHVHLGALIQPGERILEDERAGAR